MIYSLKNILNIEIKNNFKDFTTALTLTIAPNILFVIAAWYFSLGRPYLNVDYMLCSILIITKNRLLGITFLIFSFLVDSVSIFSQIFPIPRLSDIFYLLNSIGLASWSTILISASVITILLAKLIITTHLSNKTKKLPALIALNTMLLFYSIYVYSEHHNLNRFYRSVDSPIAGSQLVHLINIRESAFLDQYNETGQAFTPAEFKGVTQLIFDNIKSNTLQKKILLVINESWGVTTNNNIQENLLLPIYALKKTNFNQGVIKFNGFTITGELRELCRLKPNHFNLTSVQYGYENCLPNILNKLDYKTVSIHGANGLMYDRKDWYPRAGFSQTIFFETRLWPNLCYSFPGACDLDLVKEIPTFFQNSDKVFLYWLTLNTHSLYDKRDLKIDLLNCTEFKIEEDSESCRNLKLQAQFFYGISEMLKAPEMKGVEIFIVGDHPPIIFNGEEKQKNFVENKVPWVHFKIN